MMYAYLALVAVMAAAPVAVYVWLHRQIKELKIQIQAREDVARDYFEENERLMRIMAGNRETRRAASSQARKLVRNA